MRPAPSGEVSAFGDGLDLRARACLNAPVTRQTGPYIQAPADESILNLGLGQPSPSLLPIDEVREAANRRLGPDQSLILQYGTAPGYPGFREALAAFLTERYGHEVGADELVVTGGTSLALSMVSQVFAQPGDRVACGDPTYFLAQGIFQSQHLGLKGIPVDEGGFSVEALERALGEGLEIAFCYVIPSFQNPTGVDLEPDRAERLVELAERHDFIVVADEPYPMLHFGRAPACMMAYDHGRGRVIALGTFSKILGPGLRLGWAHAAPSVLERFLGHGTFRSGGALNPVVSSIVHGCIESGFLADHVVRLRRELGRRAIALTAAVRRHLPEAVLADPRGGYFLWLRLPGRDASGLLGPSRERHRVGFTPGPRCAVERDLSDRLRLSFSFYDEAELAEAVERLAVAVERAPATVEEP